MVSKTMQVYYALKQASQMGNLPSVSRGIPPVIKPAPMKLKNPANQQDKQPNQPSHTNAVFGLLDDAVSLGAKLIR